MYSLLKLSGLTSFLLFILNPLMILSFFIFLIVLSNETIAETNIEKCNRIIYEMHTVKSDNEKLNKQHQNFAMCIADRSSMIFVETKCHYLLFYGLIICFIINIDCSRNRYNNK